jgi:uncharacterized sulfatase
MARLDSSTLILPLFAVHGLLAAGPAAAKEGAEPEPPNIVMIVSDDHGYDDFGFMGNQLVRTPHLDRLARASARFPNGYVPMSVCRPSLATLLTGLYPHQHCITFNHPPDASEHGRHEADYLIQRVPALPRLLGEASYASFQTGKYWEGHFRTAGFSEGMTLGGRHPIMPELGWRIAHGNGDAGLLIGRRTMRPIWDFLDRHDARPFFLWYAPVLPHTPHNVAEKHLRLYAENPDIPDHMKRYYGSIARFDDTVGELMDGLRERGLVENALFVFVSDNGWKPDKKDPRRSDERSKRSPYEMGLRTPILLRWDGHIEPATHEGLVSSIDLAPTMLAAAGLAEKAGGMPGINLLPIAEGKQPLPDRPIFGATYPGQTKKLEAPEEDVLYRWARRGRMKLIQPIRAGGRPAVFDVVGDPGERRNLAGDPRHATDVAELTRLLDQWWPLSRD